MQLKKIAVYSFPELSESSKSRAVGNFLAHDEYPFWYDCEKSIKSFCAHFGVKGLDYSISPFCSSYMTAKPENDNFRGLKLASYENGEKYATTGYCEEIYMFEQFYAEWKRTGSPLLGFMFALAQGCKSIQDDMEYFCSEEYASEYLTDNEYFFDEDGEIIKEKLFAEVL